MSDIVDKKQLRWVANALMEELRQGIRGTQSHISPRFTVVPSETYG